MISEASSMAPDTLSKTEAIDCFVAVSSSSLFIMVDLNQLKDEIAAIGNQIKELKSKGADADKDAIGKAVQDLMTKKQLYADNNNGIGVDGKPFKANLSRAEKKKQQQQEKQQQQQQVSYLYFQIIFVVLLHQDLPNTHFLALCILFRLLPMPITLPRKLPRRQKRLLRRLPIKLEEVALVVVHLSSSRNRKDQPSSHHNNKTNLHQQQ